jgi:very-short-patch-repair endonuclease
VYLRRGAALDHGVRIEAARLVVGSTPVLLGPSAAWALGSRLAGPAEDVRVAVAPPARARTGPLVVRQRSRLTPGEVCDTALGPATDPVRTAVDLARGVGTRGLSLIGRVAQVDALLTATGLPVATARAGVTAGVGLHGIAMAADVLRMARNGAESVRETELRLLIVGAGLPEPVTQWEVREPGGRFLARVDLAWPQRRVAMEYDGAHHRDRSQHSRDMARQNRLSAAGWTVLLVGIEQLRHPGPLLVQLRRLLLPR